MTAHRFAPAAIYFSALLYNTFQPLSIDFEKKILLYRIINVNKVHSSRYIFLALRLQYPNRGGVCGK